MSAKHVYSLALLAIVTTFKTPFANAGGFDGFWASVGITAANQNSSSTVSYDYVDKYAGRITSPGFVVSSTYDLTVDKAQPTPAIRLLYTFSLGQILLGISASAEQPSLSLASNKFNFKSPTNWPETPKGFTMTTDIRSSFDLACALEPGFAISNSIAAILKLSYHQMSAGITTKTTIDSGPNNPSITESVSNHVFTGLGAGIGLRILYTDNAFIEPMVEHVSFQPVKAPGSTVVSTSDEMTITQSQEIALRWNAFSISVGGRF